MFDLDYVYEMQFSKVHLHHKFGDQYQIAGCTYRWSNLKKNKVINIYSVITAMIFLQPVTDSIYNGHRT